MSEVWYYIDNAGSTLGPITEQDLIGVYQRGDINDDSWIWDGVILQDWTKINDAPAMKSKMKPQPRAPMGRPAPQRASPPGRGASKKITKKKSGGGARVNLLDSIRGGKSLNKVAKKDLPERAGGNTGTAAKKARGGKMSLQDQLAMKLKKRTGPTKQKSFGSSKAPAPKANKFGASRAAPKPKMNKPSSAFNKTSTASSKFGSSNSKSAGKFGNAGNKSTSSSSKFGGNKSKPKSSGGGTPGKFALKQAIEKCNDDWILKAIGKLLDV